MCLPKTQSTIAPANYTLAGEDRDMSNVKPEMYHLDACSQGAAALIRRYKDGHLSFCMSRTRGPARSTGRAIKYLDPWPTSSHRRRQMLAMLLGG